MIKQTPFNQYQQVKVKFKVVFFNIIYFFYLSSFCLLLLLALLLLLYYCRILCPFNSLCIISIDEYLIKIST